jgi:hypothetical protein
MGFPVIYDMQIIIIIIKDQQYHLLIRLLLLNKTSTLVHVKLKDVLIGGKYILFSCLLFSSHIYCSYFLSFFINFLLESHIKRGGVSRFTFHRFINKKALFLIIFNRK